MATSIERRDVLHAFGETLKAFRLRTGLAQEKLALAAEIERTYVGGLERGQRNPTLYMILRLLPSLGVTFPEFARAFDRRPKALKRQR